MVLHKKVKQLFFIIAGLLLIYIMFSPYVVTFYVKYRYDKLITILEKLAPEIKIKTHIKYGYLKSLLVSTIDLSNDLLSKQSDFGGSNDLTNYIFHKTITLQNEIRYLPFSYSFAKVTTKVLTGLPKYIKNQNNLNIITLLDYKGQLTTHIDNIKVNYFMGSEVQNFISAEKAKIYVNDDCKNLQINFDFPKVIYQEDLNRAEIEDLNFNFKIRDYDDDKKIRIKLLTSIDNLQILNKSKLIFKIGNLSIEQKLSDKLSNNISFLNLNILQHKFGPLASKLKVHNINLYKLVEHFKDFKLTSIQDKVNKLFKHKPSVSTDLLLYLGTDKIEILSDYSIDSENVDWSNIEEVLDSLNINIFAKIPKDLAINLYADFLGSKQNDKIKPNKKELNDLVMKKITYLLHHGIIKEEDNSFIINLSISGNTFYSRMNPLKIFSF